MFRKSLFAVVLMAVFSLFSSHHKTINSKSTAPAPFISDKDGPYIWCPLFTKDANDMAVPQKTAYGCQQWHQIKVEKNELQAITAKKQQTAEELARTQLKKKVQFTDQEFDTTLAQLQANRRKAEEQLKQAKLDEEEFLHRRIGNIVAPLFAIVTQRHQVKNGTVSKAKIETHLAALQQKHTDLIKQIPLDLQHRFNNDTNLRLLLSQLLALDGCIEQATKQIEQQRSWIKQSQQQEGHELQKLHNAMHDFDLNALDPTCPTNAMLKKMAIESKRRELIDQNPNSNIPPIKDLPPHELQQFIFEYKISTIFRSLTDEEREIFKETYPLSYAIKDATMPKVTIVSDYSKPVPAQEEIEVENQPIKETEILSPTPKSSSGWGLISSWI